MKYKEISDKFELGRRALSRGYVSRKNFDPLQATVKTARSGELYIEAPNWNSSQYFYRQYLKLRKRPLGKKPAKRSKR